MAQPVNEIRKTSQWLMPESKLSAKPGKYDIYPTHHISEGSIHAGFESLANELMQHRQVFIDGYQGVFFEEIKEHLQSVFGRFNHCVNWINMAEALKTPEEIEKLVLPFLGGDDPIFGSRTSLGLIDFFEQEKLQSIQTQSKAGHTIIYGPGAALAFPSGFLVYIDLPKNEMQFRARAASITNLGATEPGNSKAMYKRFYFVDWVVLNRHKHQILNRIDIIADGQHNGGITWAKGDDFREGLDMLGKNVFRVRPWFEPGVWGGKWCLKHIEGLNSDVPNYAWSFELIVPENGLIFESSEILLEVSFDFLMFHQAANVLGDAFSHYGTEFPIRFDFLDTFDGGNLSVQCHPQSGYIKEHFGENFTQEETYYILDAAEDAVVYLGFQDNIDPKVFEKTLRESFETGNAVEIERFINKLPAKKHDLFLIPPGTVHASGKNSLVLEISTTPYIFTFKMYDWLRPDLDGKPRPLNIDRAMENLCFDRKGKYVVEHLVSKPVLIESDDGYQLWHLPTHPNHSYDVHRIHLKTQTRIQTHNKLNVLNLTEGSHVTIITENGITMNFNYAETFVIPAAAGSYQIINRSEGEVVLVRAFIK
jgi:mannose-6-phosphate isomerase class I